MRPSPAITLEFILLFWQLQGKRRNSTLASQGESSTFSITSFPGDESEPSFKDQKVQHYSLFHCSASEIRCAVSLSAVKFFQCLSLLPYIGLSRFSFSYILPLFPPFGSSA